MLNKKIKFISGSKFHQFCWELFYVLSGALGLFALMEIIKPWSVVNYLNISFVLLLWVLDAMILLAFRSEKL